MVQKIYPSCERIRQTKRSKAAVAVYARLFLPKLLFSFSFIEMTDRETPSRSVTSLNMLEMSLDENLLNPLIVKFVN